MRVAILLLTSLWCLPSWGQTGAPAPIPGVAPTTSAVKPQRALKQIHPAASLRGLERALARAERALLPLVLRYAHAPQVAARGRAVDRLLALHTQSILRAFRRAPANHAVRRERAFLRAALRVTLHDLRVQQLFDAAPHRASTAQQQLQLQLLRVDAISQVHEHIAALLEPGPRELEPGLIELRE